MHSCVAILYFLKVFYMSNNTLQLQASFLQDLLLRGQTHPKYEPALFYTNYF